MANNESLVALGNSDIKVSRVGLGAWAWGGREFWGKYDPNHIKEAFDIATQNGITWIDTAEIYGMGKSESFIGDFISGNAVRPAIATKFFPFPWRFLKSQFRTALASSMRRLHLKQIDLYQIHWPFPPMPIDTWLLAMKDAVQDGLVKLTGVSNYNVEQTKRAYELLNDHNIHLASNQVVFSLINRKIEFSGWCSQHM
jgi:aryl-alcohol dehydrogenase-like predicted oxidoreductase